MDREAVDTHIFGRLNGAGDSGRDIMEFKVKKDLVTGLSYIFNNLRPGFQEQYGPDLKDISLGR